jgi:hypothetical protein
MSRYARNDRRDDVFLTIKHVLSNTEGTGELTIAFDFKHGVDSRLMRLRMTGCGIASG